MQPETVTTSNISFEEYRSQILRDYKIALISRECSLLGRREVLTGKSKFGIFGGGKELPQLAMARVFKDGDFRSGYYRDQTFMMAIDKYSIEQFFAGLYAHTDIEKEPFAAGRQMGGHFATHSLNEDGSWKNLTQQKNSSSDISPTAGQMPRLLGLAQASKVYRNEKSVADFKNFSIDGNEVAWGTIGNASTSEGLFWETINAAGVLQVPMVISIWDDEYGISVHAKHQTTKEDISLILEGFRRTEDLAGYEIIKVKGWDYPALMDAYETADEIAREKHIPVIIHVTELTQPQGHSTSGSHERYKSKERLQWEKDFDGIVKMEEWMLKNGLADQETINGIKKEAKQFVKKESKKAWSNYQSSIIEKRKQLLQVYNSIDTSVAISDLGQELSKMMEPAFGEILSNARALRHQLILEDYDIPSSLDSFIHEGMQYGNDAYRTHLYSSADSAALNIPVVDKEFSDKSEILNGYQIINKFFDITFEKYHNTFAFGEDVGNIGDVNQGFAGLQEKFGEERIFDTGIREWSIMGQAIGMSMRGLRPIAEIQYLDYLIYGLAPLTDDLATLRYRSNNLQMAPAIIRSRGHRLEGIWHAGSPLGMILGTLRGMYVCVPRDFVQAAGMYNTLLQSTDPAIVIEVLNGYRH